MVIAKRAALSLACGPLWAAGRGVGRVGPQESPGDCPRRRLRRRSHRLLTLQASPSTAASSRTAPSCRPGAWSSTRTTAWWCPPRPTPPSSRPWGSGSRRESSRPSSPGMPYLPWLYLLCSIRALGTCMACGACVSLTSTPALTRTLTFHPHLSPSCLQAARRTLTRTRTRTLTSSPGCAPRRLRRRASWRRLRPCCRAGCSTSGRCEPRRPRMPRRRSSASTASAKGAEKGWYSTRLLPLSAERSEAPACLRGEGNPPATVEGGRGSPASLPHTCEPTRGRQAPAGGPACSMIVMPVRRVCGELARTEDRTATVGPRAVMRAA